MTGRCISGGERSRTEPLSVVIGERPKLTSAGPRRVRLSSISSETLVSMCLWFASAGLLEAMVIQHRVGNVSLSVGVSSSQL